MKYLFSLVLLFSVTLFYAQHNDSKALLKEATDGLILLNTNPEKALKQAKRIETQAQEIKAEEPELKAIQIQCEYYKIKNDFINMMEAAKRLSLQATQYKVPYYQVIAKRYLFESYLFTGLPESAFNELEEGREFVNKLDKKDSIQAIERTNFYIAYSNFYLLNEDYKNQLKYIRLAGRELQNLTDSDYKKKLLSIQYSNLASSFVKNMEMDSARHYAILSQQLHKENGRHEVKFNNLMVLGKVGLNTGNYEEALRYLKEAEEVTGYKNHLDIEVLFESTIKAYEKLGDENLARLYRAKQDSLKLVISQSQNRSLQNLLKEKKEGDSAWYLYLLLGSILVLLAIIFIFLRKNKLLAEQENRSTQFLEEFANNPSGEDFSKLLDLLKKNDPAFMFYFEKSFPSFSTRLLEINPQLSSSDIEFGALLKLKLSTKEIAKYIFRAPQTIRNKKHIIKNKLDIPKEIDIYEWFDKL